MQVKIEQLENELKNNDLNWLYLLYGNERFLLDNCVKKIKKIFGDIKIGINFVTIYENNISQLIDDIETPAFGYEKKLIFIKNSKLFERNGKKSNKDNQEKIEKVLGYFNDNHDSMQESVILVFIEESIEKNKLYNYIDKHGLICEFKDLVPNQIIARLKGICNAYKVNISNFELNYLIEQCGTNMQILINEIRKLIEYVGENGTIKKEYIDSLCIKQTEAIIFDLTDNMGKKNIKNSLNILDDLLYSKEPIQKIIVTLYNHFKKLYITKMSLNENLNLVDSLNLKPNQIFLTNKYKNQCGYFSLQELRDILNDISKLDFNYKQGLIDIDIGLRTIICGI